MMTNKPPNDSLETKLSNESSVYRVLTNATGFEKTTGRPLTGGFKRRESDKNGLSVCPCDAVTADALIARWKPKAIVSLVVGDIRSIETDPALDVIKDKPTHANITGLPAHLEDDDKAEMLATLLVRACTIVFPITQAKYAAVSRPSPSSPHKSDA